MIERRGFDADADLAAFGLGLRQIGPVHELVETAVRRDCQSSHAIMGALYSVVGKGLHASRKLRWRAGLRLRREDTEIDFNPLRIRLNALHKGSTARRIHR
jgi:hypothetical protein